jgi:hypothetical protein
MKCQLHLDWYRPIQKSRLHGALMCILRSEGLQLLAEIHSGKCGCHTASTNLVSKAYRSGFYWPTAMTDAKDLCKEVQRMSILCRTAAPAS